MRGTDKVFPAPAGMSFQNYPLCLQNQFLQSVVVGDRAVAANGVRLLTRSQTMAKGNASQKKEKKKPKGTGKKK
jgi:hypothetical protein